ncbi:MAG: metal ABC transporter ATP-binding protein [Acidimicrobiaceae bacterium]|nr:metal ABC transporter ATP-binding protein [Acidimicrobiaceae bacterium]
MQSSQPGVVVLDSVDAHRGDRLALDGVSIAVPMGSIAAVMGPNGSGKSTLFGVISGRLRHSTGSVSVGGEVAEVLQTGGIDTHLPLTVEDVVRQGRYRSRGLLRPMTRDDRRLIREAIDVVDLAAHRRTPIHALSGGQRQRAFLAQGIAQQSPILLLDEPTAGVDVNTQSRVAEVVRSVAASGTTVMISTHSLDDAVQCDLMVALAGRCLCCAPPAEALDDPEVAELLSPHTSPYVKR